MQCEAKGYIKLAGYNIYSVMESPSQLSRNYLTSGKNGSVQNKLKDKRKMRKRFEFSQQKKTSASELHFARSLKGYPT